MPETVPTCKKLRIVSPLYQKYDQKTNGINGEFFALYLFYNSFAKILFSKLTYFEIKTIKK